MKKKYTRALRVSSSETKEIARVKSQDGDRILVTALQIVLISPGQDKIRLFQMSFKPLTCFYCRKDGHMISNCPEKLKMALQRYNAV